MYSSILVTSYIFSKKEIRVHIGFPLATKKDLEKYSIPICNIQTFYCIEDDPVFGSCLIKKKSGSKDMSSSPNPSRSSDSEENLNAECCELYFNIKREDNFIQSSLHPHWLHGYYTI